MLWKGKKRALRCRYWGNTHTPRRYSGSVDISFYRARLFTEAGVVLWRRDIRYEYWAVRVRLLDHRGRGWEVGETVCPLSSCGWCVYACFSFLAETKIRDLEWNTEIRTKMKNVARELAPAGTRTPNIQIDFEIIHNCGRLAWVKDTSSLSMRLTSLTL